MIHHWVTRVLPLVAGFMQIHADPTISTSTPTPCYGDVVTVVCHHPEVASNPGRYFSTQPTWRENGGGITPSDGTMFKANTAVEPTHTNLTIIITVDHFRNKSFNYSCLLVLAKNGQPNGSETSENVTVDPVEPQPPSDIQNNTSLNTSITFNWIHTPGECYKGRISYLVYWVNINNNTENDSDVTGGHMYSMTDLVANGNYTVSVWAVVDGKFQSTAVSRNVTTGLPNKPHNIRFTECVDNIIVSWEHEDSCFEDRRFSVTWQKPGDNFPMGKTVINTTYNITGLNPDTNYNICISAVSTSDKQVKSTERCWSRKTSANLTPPKVTNIDPFKSNITVKWTPQPCAVRYRVSWMYTNDDGTTTTGSGVSDQVTNYTIPTSVQGVYTVSVQAVNGVGNVGPATSEVVRSTYPRPTADAPPCEDRSLVLTCLVSGLHNDRRSHFMWMVGNGPLVNSDQYSITGGQLVIANVSAISDEDKAIRCSEVLSNGIVVTGEAYKIEPLSQPGPLEVTITTTDSNIILTWNTALHCFESEMFTFVVIWNEIGSGTSTNVTTSSSPYTISGLQPGTSYQISVRGVSGSGVVGGIRVLNVTTTSAETPTGGVNPTTAIAIAVVVSVIILIYRTGVIAIILRVAHCQNTRIQGFRAHGPNPPDSSNPFSGRLSGACCYTTVDFERNSQTAIPPPPLERVTYAEPVDIRKEVNVCSQINDGETKPELPTKQQPRHNIEKFRSDVVDVLIAIGLENVISIETGGVPHFTAEYNGIHFVVICVYTSSDVILEDISHVVEAKQVTGSTKGLLMSNQPTIPSECLLTLEGAGCQFVPVSGYGEEGWEDRMIDKVKDVFPNVANNDSESEDLLTSEQEDQPSSIQPGTGPAPVSNNNNIVVKRRTVTDEHCVESQEETPPCHNDCSTSISRGTENEEFTTIVKTESYALDDQNVKGILPKIANNDSESEDLSTPEHVIDSSPMVPPKYLLPPKDSPPPEYQDGYSGVTSDDSKTPDDPVVYSHGCTTTSGQYSMYMSLDTSGLFMSSFKCKLSEEEEVLHKRVPWVEEEEAVPIPVQETPLTTCSQVPPSTAASIANLERPEEPLPTAACVAGGECPENVVNSKVEDSKISPEPDSGFSISESTTQC